MEIKPTVIVMIGSISRILKIRSWYLILVMMTGYHRHLSSLRSQCSLESTKSASFLCSLLLLLLLLSFILLLLYITLLFSPPICLILSFVSHITLLNWGSMLKSIIDSLLWSIKALLHGCLKSSFNVNELFNSSNILIIFSFKLLLFILKPGPCGLQLWNSFVINFIRTFINLNIFKSNNLLVTQR